MILGGMTVGEMSRRMTAVELAEWLAYFECIEPIPDPTRDAALICWVLAMINHGKGPEPRIDNFMAKPPLAERPRQTPEQMMAILGRTEE